MWEKAPPLQTLVASLLPACWHICRQEERLVDFYYIQHTNNNQCLDVNVMVLESDGRCPRTSVISSIHNILNELQAVMDVHVMVLESDGAHVGAATTAASTALADASCELYDMVPACHVVSLGWCDADLRTYEYVFFCAG